MSSSPQAEAGPSSTRSQAKSSLSPTRTVKSKRSLSRGTTNKPKLNGTSEDESAEVAAVDAHLASHRRRSSLSNFWSNHHAASKAQARRWHRLHPDDPRGDHWDDDLEGGSEEDEGLSEELQKLQEEQARVQAERNEAIRVMKDGRDVDVESEDPERDVQQEYVWDVLFENQRGIYFLGKAYFSSSTLLPTDPSPYTVPSKPLPSASSFTVSAPDGTARQAKKRKPTSASRPAGHRRSIKTLYTPDTYQPPSPKWMYLTPWMVNMRVGTDELGWRYNAWFKRKGWGSHAGPMGWAGWVRRREWVRLRCIKPEEKLLDAPADQRDHEAREEQGSLKGILQSDDLQDNVRELSRILGRIKLDRQKLDLWERWLRDIDEPSKERLETIMADEAAFETLQHTFQFRSNVPRLVDLFNAHNISLPSQPQGFAVDSPRPQESVTAVQAAPGEA